MFSKKQKKNEIDIEELKKLLVFAANRHQQDFYELLSDWNEYDPQKPYILKNCIGTILFGPPEADDNADFTSAEDSLFVYKPAQLKVIDNLYAKIIEHGTQNTKDKKVLCGLLYIVVIDEDAVKNLSNRIHKGEDFMGGDSWSEYLKPIPIFKVLKNIVEETSGKDKEGELPKTIRMENYYIDDRERVYKSWKDYLTTNVLPPCVMVVPYGGEYQGDEGEQWSEEMSYVLVDVHESPACSTKMLRALDISSTAVSLGGIALTVAAAFTPVGAAVGLAGGLGMGVSALWSIGRSSQELIDRSKHDQSINVTNKEGFTCWFGIASSTLAVASTGGTLLLTRAIRNGTTITKTAQVVHDGVQIGTITASGVNVGLSARNIYDTYKESRTISTQEIMNFAANLLLLGNSVMNLKLTKTIIETHQTAIIQDYESSLRSNRHRKEFQKMVKNTKSIVTDSSKLKEQIIRGINKIENKDEFFASILKNKKNFASKGIKPAFVEGQCPIDGKTLMNPVDFVKDMTKTSVSVNSLKVKLVVSPLASVSIPDEKIFENALTNFLKRHIEELAAFVIPKVKDFLYVLTDISRVDNADVVFSKLLFLALKLVKRLMQEDYPISNLLVEAVDFIWDYVKASIRKTLLDCETSEYREMMMKVLINLYSTMEKKLEEWVDAFKEYLRIKLRNIEDEVKKACSRSFEIINSASASIVPNYIAS